jgi:hypothetical protein
MPIPAALIGLFAVAIGANVLVGQCQPNFGSAGVNQNAGPMGMKKKSRRGGGRE